MNKQTKIFEELEQMETNIEKGWTGKIEKIEKMDSEEYYNKQGLYDNREGMVIYVRLLDGNEFNQFISIPCATGLQKSNAYLFKKRYGSYPKEGLDVEVILNEEGFFRIKL